MIGNQIVTFDEAMEYFYQLKKESLKHVRTDTLMRIITERLKDEPR